MKRWAFLLLCTMLVGCADAPPRVAEGSAAPLFSDQRFSPPVQQIQAADVFALSDEMQQYLRTEISPLVRSHGRQQALIDALSSRRLLKLEYDAAMTRNASQAFSARSGNCLSLVIMSAAFAKALELPVYFQSVALDDAAWSRSGDLYFVSGHVNLTLGRRMLDRGAGYDAARLLTIDFLPAEEILGQRTRQLSEETIVAMYMNNRAAELMAQGEINEAYWWAREALRQSPGFMAAYNTLGVIYLRHGDLAEAERALSFAVEREPRNPVSLSNLVLVQERLGRMAEAQALRQRLAAIEPYPPYHFFRLGIAAMQDGRFDAARDLFLKEIDRAAYQPEVHFWLAVACFKLGDVAQARKHLTIAMENSNTHTDRDLYAAKLDKLKSYLAQ
jgi:Flp pilus assembly protein TadD